MRDQPDFLLRSRLISIHWSEFSEVHLGKSLNSPMSRVKQIWPGVLSLLQSLKLRLGTLLKGTSMQHFVKSVAKHISSHSDK